MLFAVSGGLCCLMFRLIDVANVSGGSCLLRFDGFGF